MARERRQPGATKTHPRRRNVVQPQTRLDPATASCAPTARVCSRPPRLKTNTSTRSHPMYWGAPWEALRVVMAWLDIGLEAA
jgi:hypothetical protein